MMAPKPTRVVVRPIARPHEWNYQELDFEDHTLTSFTWHCTACTYGLNDYMHRTAEHVDACDDCGACRFDRCCNGACCCFCLLNSWLVRGLTCGLGMALYGCSRRVELRTKYGIDAVGMCGSFTDCCFWWSCPHLAAMQEFQETRARLVKLDTKSDVGYLYRDRDAPYLAIGMVPAPYTYGPPPPFRESYVYGPPPPQGMGPPPPQGISPGAMMYMSR